MSGIVPEDWYLTVAVILLVLIAVYVAVALVDRLLGPPYRPGKRPGAEQMTRLHGGSDDRNEHLTGFIDVPDVEEIAREAERSDRPPST